MVTQLELFSTLGALVFRSLFRSVKLRLQTCLLTSLTPSGDSWKSWKCVHAENASYWSDRVCCYYWKHALTLASLPAHITHTLPSQSLHLLSEPGFGFFSTKAVEKLNDRAIEHSLFRKSVTNREAEGRRGKSRSSWKTKFQETETDRESNRLKKKPDW